MAAQDNSRFGQLASLVLIEPLAHVRGDGYLPGKHAAWPRRTIRGGCTPGNSRRVTAQDNSRLWQLASLVLIERIAHVRGPVPGLSIRANGRQATLAPVQEDSARARGLHPGQFAPGGGELRSRLYEPLAHVRGGGIFRTKEPGRQFQGRGAAGGKKAKEKRPWQTPLAFSL